MPTLLLLIALHDIGKFSRPFQAKQPALWPVALGELNAQREPRHDTAGHNVLEEAAFSARLAPLFPGLGRGDRRSLHRAVCGHHGRPPAETMDSRTFCPASRAAALAFVDDLITLLAPVPLPALPERDVTALSWWLAGLTVLADWLGSNEQWFAYPAPAASLGEYWPKACLKAERAVAEAGLLPVPPAPELRITALVGDHPPTPLQDFVSTMPLPSGPLLILVEDQMGSGKTEAALLLAHRLMQAEGAAGLFMALPTMATANALYTRLGTTYHALFAAGSAPSLVLAHGKSHLSDGFAEALARADDRADRADHDADETASAQCAAWIGDDRRRSFLAACGAGTIDQAVLAVLPSRHAPLRLFGLSQRVLIIDEAHAYDEYVTEELRRLIEFQACQGGSTIVLSATLPRQTRDRLVSAFGSTATCQKDGYPLITVVSRKALAEYEPRPRPGLARRIVVQRVPDAAAALEVVCAAASRGAAVGWVRNTVDDAIAAQAALRAQGVDATLFHARFAMGDRLAIEAAVQRRFGKDSVPAQRAHVIVGTQVMEQSLDVDFDLLITDLAPVDLMLQRAGRLWRHTREERPETEPRLYVIAPAPVEAPGADWLQDFRGTAAVYDDPALLWRSCRALFAKPVLCLPEDVRGLVEAVYTPDADIPVGLERRSTAATGKGAAARGMAWQNLLSWQEGYAESGGAWMSDAVTPTRLTEPSFAYRLAVWANGVLTPLCAGRQAWAMSEVMLPARRVKTVPEETGARGAALAALRAVWSRWEQDVPVIILEPGEEGFFGEVVDPAGTRRAIAYNSQFGLMFV